ncbi:Fibronectin type III domain-containing protein 7, partial [Cricetulus griseus]
SAPEIPTIDQAYSKISNSITVEWTTVPGATGYLLTAEDGDTIIETTVASSPGTVTGLKAATLYQITIRSISASGRSQASSPKQAKTVLAAPVLEVGSPSPDSIFVRWDAVYMAIGFSVSVMRANGLGRIWKENTTNTSLTFSSLEAGTLYTIKAYAWNANGIPGDDSTCNLRTSPRAPANIEVFFDSGSLKASVSWTPTEGAFNYTVMASSDSSQRSCSTALSSCSISALQCGTEYLISVSASNDAGSSRSSAGTLKTAPCCPSDISAVLVSSDRMEIAWSPVRGAELYETKATAGFSVVECNDTAPACTLSALDCDTKYNITVYSFSEVRGSNLSCSSQYITTGMELTMLSFTDV